MKRAALFLALFAVFLFFTFPHELVVRRLLLSRIPPDVSINFSDVSPTLHPLGYRLTSVELSHDPFHAKLDSVSIGFSWLGKLRLDVVACGGNVSGRLLRGSTTDGGRSRDLEVDLSAIEPSRCLDLGGPSLEGRFHGRITLVGVGDGNAREALGKLARSGSISLEGENGVVSGYFPASRSLKPSGKRREPQPIGRWEFSRVAIDAAIKPDRVVIERGEAVAEGLSWETGVASIILAGQTPRVQAELIARRLEDSARSKAIIGLLPKAAAKDGRYRYRLSGPVSAVQITGLK
jgi:type II secretion system protein N